MNHPTLKSLTVGIGLFFTLPLVYANSSFPSLSDGTLYILSLIHILNMGGMTAFNNPIGNWSNAYNMLNYVNSFLENGLTDQVQYNRTDPEVDKQIKLRLEGESYFLRAWWHFELLKMYGGKAKNGKALGIPLARCV